MSSIHVGSTIKITGADRHPEADSLLLQHVDLTHATVVDLGASDGSTSFQLLRRLSSFGSFVIADLYLHVYASHVGRSVLLFDASGTCILVSGRRLLAWPSLSRLVRLLYLRSIRRARKAERAKVLLLNPEVRAVMATDPRVSYREHDVFSPWTGPQPHVFKVANLLRRLYFSDTAISTALSALLSSLQEGGHLLIVDNPRIAGIDYRAGLYEKRDGRFRSKAMTEHPPEIDDLVRVAVAAPALSPTIRTSGDS